MSGGLRLFWIAISLLLVTACISAQDNTAGKNPAPPKAKVTVVEDTVQGHKISDPYRYLEDPNNPDTQQFVQDELAYTRAILDPLPGRALIHDRLSQLLSIGQIGTPQPGGPYYFHTRREGTQNQPVLLVREGVQGKDRALVNVNQLAADGTVALDWWVPSEEGKYVAYGTSPGGSEQSTLHIIETATGRLLTDTIDRTRYANVSWKKDSSGFFYTRTPKKGDVPAGEEVYHAKVFYHEIGSDPDKDALIFEKVPQIQDVPTAQLSDDDDRWLLINVNEGWAKSKLYVQDLKAGTPPVEVSGGKNFLYSGEVFRGKLYVFTNEDAPRFRLFAVDATKPQRESWKELIPEGDGVLKNVSVLGEKLIALYEKNASSELRLLDLDGKLIKDIPLPEIGTITALGGKWDRDDVFYGFNSFTVPPSVYQISITSGKSGLWDKVETPGVDPSAFEVHQLWFNSKDGTRVPMFVFYKKGLQLNGANPTLLTGYGGFNVSLTPGFIADRYLWLEHGGVFAVANLRGGSEFGEEWHRAGMLDKKQNTFDDFIAASEFLIAQKYTDKAHLAIRGGSNGGLLMGAAFTQRPDLFRAVVCSVPLLDMLRYQGFQIARFWIPEYGSSDDATQFNWLYAYSPYHHVKPGTEYPAILFTTADTDTRVDPMHAKKMAALMQAEAANGQSRERPILLRIQPKAGHGAGKPIAKQIEELTDVYSFLFWQVGTKL